MKKFLLFLSILCSVVISMPLNAAASQSEQKNKVTVTVVDAQGPVIGAGVVIKGTTTGFVTDMDGVVTFDNVTAETVLEVTCLGYASQEVKVGSRAAITVTLEQENTVLDETIVVGYGVQKKESLTSAIAQISSEDITNTKHTDAIVSLQGKVPGLLIREQSGKPGNFATDLSLRGYGTPMIVVDGVVRSGSATRKTRGFAFNARSYEDGNDLSALQEINPDDIESISVLKDASATIYGLGAANGVILITTKKGKATKPSVSYSGSVRLQKPVTIHDVEPWGEFMKWDNAMADVAKMSHRYKEEDIAAYERGEGEFHDWYNIVHKKVSVNQSHNVSISGGTEKIRYYFGAGYSEDKSILRSNNNEYNRYNLNGNVTAQITDNLEAKYSTSIRLSKTVSPGNPNIDWNMFYYLYATDPTVAPHVKDNPAHFSEVNEHMNVVALLDKETSGYALSLGRSFQNTLDLTYKAPFLKGLQFQATGAYDLTANKSRTLVKAFDLYNYKDDSFVATLGETEYSEMWNDNQRLYARAQANYNNQFGDHNIGVTFAAEMTNIKTAMVDLSRKYGATQDDSFYTHDTINMGLSSTAENSGRRSETMTAGYIGRVSYNYKGKYLAEVMARYDGTYVYAPGHRWGLFPSYSLGWRVSEEPFFKNAMPWFNNLKLRWSDGKTGSVQGGAYAYIGGYTSSGSWVFTSGNTVKGFNSTTVENTILSWADVRMMDFGFDWEMKKGLIGGSFDWYKRITDGTAATRSNSLPDFYGVSLPSENLNASEHTGLEMTLTHRHNIGKFNYRVQATATYYRTRQTYDIKQDPSNPDHQKWASAMSKWKGYMVGRWSNARGASRYEWEGDQFTSLNEIADYPILYSTDPSAGGNRGIVPGMYKLVDRNGNGYIDGDDVYYRWGDANPPLQFGFNITGSYKNFDFSIVFSGASLKSKAVSLSGYTGFGYLYQIPRNYTTDCWHVKNYGADPWDPATEWVSGYWPALARVAQTGSSHNATYVSNQPYNYADASYLRLKSVELGYRIPGNVIKKVGLKSARVFFNGGNLLTFCNKMLKYVDPESTDSGRQGGTFQINKTFNFGVNLNF